MGGGFLFVCLGFFVFSFVVGGGGVFWVFFLHNVDSWLFLMILNEAYIYTINSRWKMG